MQPPKLLLALSLAATGLAQGIHPPHQAHPQEPDLTPRDDANNDMVQMVHQVDVPLLQAESDCPYCATATIPLDMEDFITQESTSTAGLDARDISITAAPTGHVFNAGHDFAELELPGGQTPGFMRTTTRRMKHHPLHDITFEYTITATEPNTAFVMTVSDEKHGTSTISASVSTVSGGTREVLVERFVKSGSNGYRTTVTAYPSWKPANTSVDKHEHTRKPTPSHVQMNFPTDKSFGEVWTTTLPVDDSAMVTADITVMDTRPTHYMMTLYDGDYTEVVEAQVSRGGRPHHVSLEETIIQGGLKETHTVTWPNPKPKTKGAIARRAVRTMVVTVLDQQPGYTTLNSPTYIDSDVATSFITVTETKQVSAPLTPEEDVTTVTVETTVTRQTTIQGAPTTVTTTQATTLTVAPVEQSTTSSSSSTSSQTSSTSSTSSEPTTTAEAQSTTTSSSDGMPAIFTRFNVPFGSPSDEAAASPTTTESSVPQIFQMPCNPQEIMSAYDFSDMSVDEVKEENPDLDWKVVEFVAKVFRGLDSDMTEGTAQAYAVECMVPEEDNTDSDSDSTTCACPAPGLVTFGTPTPRADPSPISRWNPPGLVRAATDITPPPAAEVTSSSTVSGNVTGMLVVDALAASHIPTKDELWKPACQGKRRHMSKEQQAECSLQKCMWKYIQPINYTTIFPAMMFDPYGATAMTDFVTQSTSLVDYAHWGTTEDGIYYPMMTTTVTATRERMDIAAGTLFVETRMTPTAFRQAPTGRAKATRVARDPKCWDEESCYNHCLAGSDEDTKHFRLKHYLLVAGLPAAIALLAALCCCCGGLRHHKRRKQPVDEKNPNVVQVVTTQAVETPAAAGAAAAAAARGGSNQGGAGTTGRQAEEGRSRVHFPEDAAGGAGHTATPAGPTAAAPVEKVVQVPVKSAEKAAGAEHVETVPAHDGADGHRTGSEMMDMGSLRGRKKNRIE